jgi:hypothetical protein
MMNNKKPQSTPEPSSSAPQPPPPPAKSSTPHILPLREQLVKESSAMAKHAFTSGLVVPGGITQVLERYAAEILDKTKELSELKPLITVHERLARIVEPAKPRTILLMEEESLKPGLFKFLGAVPFIRRMMIAAIVSLVLFIAISLSSHINNEPDTWNLFMSEGWPLLLKEMFLLCAAGLGASFTALFRANRYIVEGTFDPKYESSYWIRFILGIISGMLLATLIPIEESMKADFGKPLLAMLGGFSADLVYRIISRLIETLESLFRGDTKTLVNAKSEQAKVKLAEEESKNRFKAASNLMKIQQEINADSKPEEIKNKMNKLMDNMVQIDTEEDEIK